MMTRDDARRGPLSAIDSRGGSLQVAAGNR